jgi:thiosulfate/3-mercaptopyruvate sulfurtransferase
MRFDTLIDPADLAEGLRGGACIAVDCRFDLSDPDKGRQDYLSGHIPGARYAHLDDDLSAPGTPSSGRHPLPPPAAIAAFLSRIGWIEDRLLVAYDERNNAIAARLWWLMCYFGKPAALLDGGLEAWQRAGLPLEAGMPKTKPSIPPELEPQAGMTVSADQILAAEGRFTLIDARAAERYRGETEPLDARGGHIPGALNRPMGLNLDESGRFKPAERLREEFRKLVGAADPGTVVNYCGSGVTACHNLFAMERAGYADARVYPGSWSEWLRDADRPVATGGD